MMSGALNFTLGLQANQFLNAANISTKAILGLSAAGEAINVAFRKMWDVVGQGAELKDMSARTGESVESLFNLRHALDIVGVGADAAAPMVLKLQKSMSGVTEDGEKTADLLKAIGLNADQLKRMDVTERIIAIGTALNNINSDQATGIASKIFGREGAGNIVQIARSMDDFKQSLVDASPAARVFQRTADLFDKIDDTITTIKMKIGGMWAGMAEGLGPALQKLLDFANSLDFVGFGERIGQELQLVINSFDAGKFAEYFTLAIQAGLQEGINFLATTDWSAVVGNIKEALFGTSKLQEQIRADIEKVYRDALRGKFPAGEDLNSMNPSLAKLNKLRGELAGPASDTNVVPFINFLTDLGGQFKRTVDLPGKDEPFKSTRPDVTALEKIGLVIGGRSSSTADYARQTADFTRQTVDQLKIANRHLTNQAVDFSRQ